jgi:hypothetical protein
MDDDDGEEMTRRWGGDENPSTVLMTNADATPTTANRVRIAMLVV